MKYLTAITLLAVSVGLVLADGLKSQIVGKWSEIGGKDQIEFAANGTFTGNMVQNGMPQVPLPVAGTYVVENGGKVSLQHTGGYPMVWNVKISLSGNLTILYEKGGLIKTDHTKAEFKRSK
jgi:hypothetical protein